MLFVCNLLFINNAESSTNINWVISLTNDLWATSVTITSTNLVIKYPPSGERGLMVSFDRWDFELNTYCFMPKPNEEFVINTNRTTELWHGWSGLEYKFTPVSYTNNLIGFRIDHTYEYEDDPNSTRGKSKTNTYYIALSDVPVEVGEADVENPNIAKQEDED